jgi:hypothetical protein
VQEGERGRKRAGKRGPNLINQNGEVKKVGVKNIEGE